MTQFQVVELEKASSMVDPHETVSVWLNGQRVLEARPLARGQLEVGRLIVGSVAAPAVGASIWDWLSYRVVGLAEELPSQPESMGGLKARYR